MKFIAFVAGILFAVSVITFAVSRPDILRGSEAQRVSYKLHTTKIHNVKQRNYYRRMEMIKILMANGSELRSDIRRSKVSHWSRFSAVGIMDANDMIIIKRLVK